MLESIERNFYYIPSIPGRIIGIYPQPAKPPLHAYILFSFAIFVVSMGAIGENLYGVIYLDNLVDALEAFCPGSIKLVSAGKMIIFFMHRNRFHCIMQRLRAIIKQNKQYAYIIEKLSSTANSMVLVLLLSGSATNALFSIIPLLMHAYRRWYGLPGELPLPFKLILPKFASEYPFFPLTYALLFASGACTSFTCSFIDGYFLYSCMYICGGFRMLQQDIRQIFADLPSCEIFSATDNAIIRSKLISIVHRHNAFINLCRDLTNAFHLMILVYFFSAAFILCSTILDIILNTTSINVLIYITYCVAALLELFLYCYGGNHVSESSIAVSNVLYDIEWYKCDVMTRRMILMMLQRSQKATIIAVPFFTMTLTAFRAILSTTGSYITLLKTLL